MTNRALYNLFIPDTGSPRNTNQRNRRLFEAGTISAGPAALEDLSGDPTERTVEGTFRGTLADLMFEDLEEITEISDVSVPFYKLDGDGNEVPWAGNGYYKVERVEETTPDSRAHQNYVEFTATLKRVGGHETHFRSVEVDVSEIENAFGNDQTADIQIPAAAEKVRWFDVATEDLASASALGTRDVEDGTVEIYDAEATNFEKPALIYEIDFGGGFRTDATVWDDHDRLKVQTTDDGTEYNAWQHVFDETHEFHGNPVVDSGYHRLHVDESAGQFTAEEWDASSSAWTDVGLDWAGTDWTLFDWDFDEITPTEIRSQVTFEHPDDGFYALNATLSRGADAVLFAEPPGESGATPSGLQTLLSPLASTTVLDSQMTLGLVARQDVRR